MLDNETKRRINSLRDILVGKLPDPKAQVEQITNGLIYKFMNDMDNESVSMGGKATYFSGKFKKYSWKHLMDTKTSGVEKVSLYSEGIEQMYNNENLPELFREIFKNSFLPFKDASTLNMFLKEINNFNYSNSEKLGDAFEYLLSFMGSQGDAGQFRTPRHIIDFIVEIVNPQKNETVLDPACGTAGFLISSYKHILNQNTKKNLGDALSASDRKKIGENLNGYDISPDMVKMSLVNMYLHKFSNPKINEYDTLSSEDRWNEYYDVILANPPFFSPKGGITPHNRFGVKSTKAEVLFVDYINEHLKPNGRAGIIVPEGIILQNGGAYKQIRKKLIEQSLLGVISLPVGVFLPYSAVKTSILIIDKLKSKKTDSIFFVRIKNDGFELNSNRKQIKENDLPSVTGNLNGKNYKDLITYIKKEKVLSGDYSFSFSRYKSEKIFETNYKIVKIKDYANFKRGTSITRKNAKDGKIPVVAGGKSPAYFHNQSNRNSNCITISSSGAYAGYINFHRQPIFASDCFTIETNSASLNQEYLFYILKSKQKEIYDFQSGAAQPHVYPKDFDDFKIPLPSIEKQESIVQELDNYTKIIHGCRQIVENYKPSIEYKLEYKKVKLGKICKFSGGTQPPKSTFVNLEKDGYIRLLQIRDYKTDKFITYIPKSEKHKTCNEEDIMIGRYGPPVFQILRGKSGAYNVALMKCLPDNKLITNDWLYYFLSSKEVQEKIISLSERVRQSGVRPDDLNNLDVPLPSIDEQNHLTTKIKDEMNIIYSNQKLINIIENKIDEKISSIWIF